MTLEDRLAKLSDHDREAILVHMMAGQAVIKAVNEAKTEGKPLDVVLTDSNDVSVQPQVTVKQ